jgi:hypothetical protein
MPLTAAFSFAAAVYIWKLMTEGPSLQALVFAGGFTIAAVIWLFISLHARSSTRGGKDRSGSD